MPRSAPNFDDSVPMPTVAELIAIVEVWNKANELDLADARLRPARAAIENPLYDHLYEAAAGAARRLSLAVAEIGAVELKIVPRTTGPRTEDGGGCQSAATPKRQPARLAEAQARAD